MKTTTGLALALLVSLASTAHATNYVVYAHGRGMQQWDSKQRVNLTGTSWVQAPILSYDGGASIAGPATSTLRTHLETYCAGGNTCVIVCHSAGCYRVLKAVHDSTKTFSIASVRAIASAAGGTKIAESVTTGSLKNVAKLMGQQEAVDWDLTPAAARGTYGNIQDAMNLTTGYMYHYAGNQDTCMSLLFFKVCGNKYVTAGIGGSADGLVGFDSAGGAHSQGGYTNICTVGSYYAHRVAAGTCTGEARNHSGMVGIGVTYTETAIAQASHTGDKNLTMSQSTAQSACSTSSCDQAFTNQSTDQTVLHPASGGSDVTVAANTDGTSSPSTANTSSTTSCTGRCGLYQPGRACQCDSACASANDCCADYTTPANCNHMQVW